MEPEIIHLIRKENRTRQYIIAAIVTFIFFILGIIPAVIAVTDVTNPITRIADGFCFAVFLLIYIACLIFIFWRNYTNTPQYKLLTTEKSNLKTIEIDKPDSSEYKLNLDTYDNKQYTLKCSNEGDSKKVCKILEKKFPNKIKKTG